MPLKQNELLDASLVLKQAAYVRRDWQFTIPSKFSYEDICLPERWKHLAEHMNEGDHVVCIAEDKSWDAEFRVLATGKGSFVLLRPLSLVRSPQIEPVEPGAPCIGFVPTRGYVIYDALGEAISAHPSHDAATEALNEYLAERKKEAA
jgi:hypothetical protein